jgi:hypothetical protein
MTPSVPPPAPLEATAEQVHESALLVSNNFAAFYDAYREWIRRGFAARP